MPLWFAAFLGLVQGLTEFLPVSSTAHLRIAPALLGLADPGAAFTAVIQLGTLAAVVVYFARDLAAMARAIVVDRRSREARLALYLVIGTFPIGIAGLLLKRFIVGDARSLWVVAASLACVAALMWVADRAATQRRGLEGITLRDALLVGLAQACALVPGVSRSGATLTAALLIGMRRDDGARFSFLLSIPAVAAAGLFEVPDALRELAQAGGGTGTILPLLLATVVAAVSGYVSIAWLIGFLRRRTLAGFAYYRFVLSGALVALVAAGLLSPR